MSTAACYVSFKKATQHLNPLQTAIEYWISAPNTANIKLIYAVVAGHSPALVAADDFLGTDTNNLLTTCNSLMTECKYSVALGSL